MKQVHESIQYTKSTLNSGVECAPDAASPPISNFSTDLNPAMEVPCDTANCKLSETTFHLSSASEVKTARVSNKLDFQRPIDQLQLSGCIVEHIGRTCTNGKSEVYKRKLMESRVKRKLNSNVRYWKVSWAEKLRMYDFSEANKIFWNCQFMCHKETDDVYTFMENCMKSMKICIYKIYKNK